MTNWSWLLESEGPMVWRTVYRLLNHHADACDCFQETFLAYVKLTRRQVIDDPPAMLRTIATARALDRLRQRARTRLRITPMPDDLPDGTDPLELAEAEELRRQLCQALADLPGKQAQAYCLRFVEGLSYAQIAATMGITIDSAGVLLHRARQQLRAILSDHELPKRSRSEV